MLAMVLNSGSHVGRFTFEMCWTVMDSASAPPASSTVSDAQQPTSISLVSNESLSAEATTTTATATATATSGIPPPTASGVQPTPTLNTFPPPQTVPSSETSSSSFLTKMIPLITVVIFMIVIFTLAAVIRRILNARKPPAESIRQRRRTRMASEFQASQIDISPVPDYLPAYEPKSPDGNAGPTTRSLTSNDENEVFVDAPQSITLDVEDQENQAPHVGTMPRRVTFSRQVTVNGPPPRVQTDVLNGALDAVRRASILRPVSTAVGISGPRVEQTEHPASPPPPFSPSHEEVSIVITR
ncbi:hypothetical protein HDU78_008558 [Chytriomyces hyalinus]|nr:hypothetical protein HDU78_008558 [Chytriomyces hyalinus]